MQIFDRQLQLHPPAIALFHRSTTVFQTGLAGNFWQWALEKRKRPVLSVRARRATAWRTSRLRARTSIGELSCPRKIEKQKTDIVLLQLGKEGQDLEYVQGWQGDTQPRWQNYSSRFISVQRFAIPPAYFGPEEVADEPSKDIPTAVIEPNRRWFQNTRGMLRSSNSAAYRSRY